MENNLISKRNGHDLHLKMPEFNLKTEIPFFHRITPKENPATIPQLSDIAKEALQQWNQGLLEQVKFIY